MNTYLSYSIVVLLLFIAFGINLNHGLPFPNTSKGYEAKSRPRRELDRLAQEEPGNNFGENLPCPGWKIGEKCADKCVAPKPGDEDCAVACKTDYLDAAGQKIPCTAAQCATKDFCGDKNCCTPEQECPTKCLLKPIPKKPPPPEDTPYADVWTDHNQNETEEENKVGLKYNEPCNYYGSTHKYEQEDKYKTLPKRGSDSKLSQISSKLCRLDQRLECIPAFGFPPPPSVVVSGNAPFVESEERTGYCRCMRELSTRAVYVEEGDKIKAGCYIPAGFDWSSTCGHIVALPYGELNTVEDDTRYPVLHSKTEGIEFKDKRILRRTIGDTTKMCVPYSKCRKSGSGKYDGSRCQCNKKTRHNRQTGICELIYHSDSGA